MAQQQTNQNDADQDDDDLQSGDTTAQSGQKTNGAAANGQDDDFEIIETDDAGKPLVQNDAGDDDQGHEANLSEGDQGQETLLQRRARERTDDGRSKNVRRREARERTEAENARLKARIAALETDNAEFRQFAGRVEPQLAQFSVSQLKNQLSQVDGELARATTSLDTAKRGVAEAIRNNDEEALLKALDTRDAAFIERQKLDNQRAQIAKVVEGAGKDGGRTGEDSDNQGDKNARDGRQQQRQTPIPLSRDAEALANAFRAKHRWINPKSDDPDIADDSDIVLTLDRQVQRAGFKPETQEYWDELEARMRDTIPDRVPDRPRSRAANGNGAGGNGKTNGNAHVPPARRGPMTTGASGGNGSNGKRVFHLSPARKEALIQRGVLDHEGRPTDQAKFKSLVNQYIEFDRANGTTQQ